MYSTFPASESVPFVTDTLYLLVIGLIRRVIWGEPCDGLGEEIRVAVEPERPRVKHEALDMNLGGIDALFGSDVPDVFGRRIDPAHMQRLEWAAVEIGDVALAYLQPVDLQIQRDGLERLLPSAIFQGDVAGCFGAQILEIGVNRRPVKDHVRDDLAVEQCPPVNRRRERADLGHRGNRIGILGDRRVQQLERHGPWVDVKCADRDRVTREPAVDFALHVTVRGPVESERRQHSDAEKSEEN